MMEEDKELEATRNYLALRVREPLSPETIKNYIVRLQASMGIPPLYQGVSLTELTKIDKEIERARKAVDENRSVTLFGQPGTGKTHMATCLLRIWFVANQEEYRRNYDWSLPRFVTTTELLLAIKKSWSAQEDVRAETEAGIIEKYGSVPMLVLDDLGPGNWTEWSRGVIYSIVNYRYNHERPMIVTSNLSLVDLANTVDDRIVSRLCEMGETIAMPGPDRRTG